MSGIREIYFFAKYVHRASDNSFAIKIIDIVGVNSKKYNGFIDSTGMRQHRWMIKIARRKIPRDLGKSLRKKSNFRKEFLTYFPHKYRCETKPGSIQNLPIHSYSILCRYFPYSLDGEIMRRVIIAGILLMSVGISPKADAEVIPNSTLEIDALKYMTFVSLDDLFVPIPVFEKKTVPAINFNTYPRIIDGDILVNSQADASSYYSALDGYQQFMTSGQPQSAMNIVGVPYEQIRTRGLAVYRFDAATFNALNSISPNARANAILDIEQELDIIYANTGIAIIEEGSVTFRDYPQPPAVVIKAGTSSFTTADRSSITFNRTILIDTTNGNRIIPTISTIQHEFLHMMGVHHEMLRNGAANFNRLFPSSDGDTEFQYGYDTTGNYIGGYANAYTPTYDPNSIMTYPRYNDSICSSVLPADANLRQIFSNKVATLNAACRTTANVGGVTYNIPNAAASASPPLAPCDVECVTVPNAPLTLALRSVSIVNPGDDIAGLARMYRLNAAALPDFTAFSRNRIQAANVLANLITLNRESLNDPAANNTVDHQLARQILTHPSAAAINNQITVGGVECEAKSGWTVTGWKSDYCEATVCASIPSSIPGVLLSSPIVDSRCRPSFHDEGRTACITANAYAGQHETVKTICDERSFFVIGE